MAVLGPPSLIVLMGHARRERERERDRETDRDRDRDRKFGEEYNIMAR